MRASHKKLHNVMKIKDAVVVARRSVPLLTSSQTGSSSCSLGLYGRKGIQGHFTKLNNMRWPISSPPTDAK